MERIETAVVSLHMVTHSDCDIDRRVENSWISKEAIVRADSASTLRIPFPPLISKLAYAAPEIHNLCRHAENHLGACLSMLDDSGDFWAAR